MESRKRRRITSRIPGMFPVGLILIVASLSASFASPARIRFDRLSIKDGLPRTTIISITQDTRGFLWVATFDGLARYDGRQFMAFVHRPGDSTSLMPGVRQITVDRQGTLWAATDYGISRFNRESESFTNFSPDAGSSGSSSNKTMYLYEDRSGVLWVGTENGLLSFDREANRFVRRRVDASAPDAVGSDYITAVVEDLDGRLWVGTNNGLYLFNRSDGTSTCFRNHPGDPRSLSSNSIWCLTADRSGTLWVGTRREGLNRLPRGSTHFVRYRHDPGDPSSMRSNAIMQILEDRGGDLWIATNGGGLERYDRTADRFIHHQKDNTYPASLSSNLVRCLFEDPKGVLYIGTDFGGLNTLDRRKDRFRLYEYIPGRAGSLPENHIHAIYEDPADSGRTLWLGTRGGGLALFDRERERFTAFKHNPADRSSISDNIVRCITKDSRGSLWVGTNNGLNRFDRRSGKFTRYLHDPALPRSLRRNSIIALFEDREGTLWVGTIGGGLEEFDRERKGFVHHVHDPRDSTSISDNTIWSVLEDHTGALWIGTNDGGLNRYDRAMRRFTRFMWTDSPFKSVASNKVLCLYEGHDRSIWIGTAGGGLTSYDPESGSFTSFGQQQDLAPRTIQAIVEDTHGCLWISTPQGIHRFDPRSRTFTAHDMQEGLQGGEFQVNAACRSVTGEIFFGGNEGLNAFLPEHVEQGVEPPPIAITGFQLYNTPVTYGMEVDGRIPVDTSIIEKRTMKLSYADEVFSIEFATLEFAPSVRTRLAFMMEGFEKEWNAAGDKRSATYRKLPPGHYVFHVRVMDNSGTPAGEGATLNIDIASPFWQTWWFRALAVALAIGAILGGHSLRTHRIRRHAQELERRVLERTAQLDAANKDLEAFAYSVSHDLRAPLRAIDGFSLILLDDHGPALNVDGRRIAGVIRDEVKRMSALIDDILTFSRLGRATLHHAPIDMTALVESVYLMLTTPEQRARIDFTLADLIAVHGDLALLRQVWTNLVSNAIKFSSKVARPSIRIDCRVSDGEVIYSIRDNGAGFDMEYADKLFGVFHRLHRQEDFEGTGVGLAIVQRLVQRHGGRVWAESAVGKGATFFFTLPRKTGAT